MFFEQNGDCHQLILDRMKTYQDIQDVFYEEMPLIPLANAMQICAWNKRVNGFERYSSSRFFFGRVWLSSEVAKH